MFGFLNQNNNINNSTSPTRITPTAIPIEYEIKDILVDSDEEKYECDICTLELFNESESQALQCKEGHLACRSCWERYLGTDKKCMTCKTPISSISELSRNRYLEGEYSNWIDNRLVFCPYSKENIFRLNMSGLPAINNSRDQTLHQDICNHGAMKFSELGNHYDICESRILQCNLCLIKFCRKDSDKHQNECSKVYSKCEYCNLNIQRSSLSVHHITFCTKYLIECSHCKIMIQKVTKTKHLIDDCEEIMILCQEYSCGKRFTRSKMQIHSLEHSVTKLMNQNEIIKKDNQSFLNQEKKIEEINRKLNILLYDYTQLKKEMTALKQNGFIVKEYSNKWIIPEYRNFSALYTHKKSEISNDFQVGSHTFNIKIYPNGVAGKQGKFAIFLERKPRSGILLKYMFSFYLIPPEGSTATIESLGPCHRDFEESRTLSWGTKVFTDSRKVLKDFLNEKGELELSFSITIQDEKIIPL
ncbi:hypothetical protein ACTFIR_007740 [Dictyostelium discoideum]